MKWWLEDIMFTIYFVVCDKKRKAQEDHNVSYDLQNRYEEDEITPKRDNSNA